ncbi:GH25 family lysozyme [uncultured Tateyamaria sp.]|uniref:glycoside hydrolase family 25 protein n=1 Tax=Tateyamaria sp. 1078 TaxID=3417464 RepID=UPI00262A1B4F|nr:GH25 family lysozyme [uncultured Tateyamaria sp.]
MKRIFASLLAGLVACATLACAETAGIDVSKWQGGDIDYATVKDNGMAYVFVKATEGNTEVDPDFARNFANAKAAGLLVGAYHFFITGDAPQTQFDNYSKAVTLRAGDLPPVVDIETLDGGTAAEVPGALQQFLDLLEQHYGTPPIIYSGESFANSDLNGFGNYPLWVAEYTSASSPKLPRGWDTWTFWQYSQSGKVAGIDGAVDLNRFNGDAAQLNTYLIK